MKMSGSFTLTSHSEAQTRKIGRELGKLLKGGDTVLLEGELGAGKTTLAQGIARGLGVPVKTPVTSPTFTLIHEYEGREKLFHMDWYRLSSVKGEDEEEFLERLSSHDAVCLVEWPERGRALWPEERLEIFLNHKGPNERQLEIRGRGKRYEELVLSVKKR